MRKGENKWKNAESGRKQITQGFKIGRKITKLCMKFTKGCPKSVQPPGRQTGCMCVKATKAKKSKKTVTKISKQQTEMFWDP